MLLYVYFFDGKREGGFYIVDRVNIFRTNRFVQVMLQSTLLQLNQIIKISINFLIIQSCSTYDTRFKNLDGFIIKIFAL